MKTILIAEDEKFIRKGLVTMVQRSPIPAETILEARDGEEALELLRQNEVDLLITDIRMPKIDGIELVSQLGDQDHQPMVLVISGYDDFSYAVEMLRNGAFDYLLKPVEREKLFAVLKKLEAQYRQKQARREERSRQLVRALRHLMLEQDADSPEWREQADRCREGFFPGPYVGFCAGGCDASLPEVVLRLHAVGALHLYAAPEEGADALAALLPVPLGRSGVHTGPDSLPLCYQEARAAWQRSFFTGEPFDAPAPEAFQPLSVTVEQLMGLAGLSRGRRHFSFCGARANVPPGARPARRPCPPCAPNLPSGWAGTTASSWRRAGSPGGSPPYGSSPPGHNTWTSWAVGWTGSAAGRSRSSPTMRTSRRSGRRRSISSSISGSR